MEDGDYEWPSGTYVNEPDAGMTQIMMAMDTSLSPAGLTYKIPSGTDEELSALKESFDHLVKLRDEVIEMGVLPPLDQWSAVNPNL